MNIKVEKAARILDAPTALRLLTHAVQRNGAGFTYTRPLVAGNPTPVCSYFTDDSAPSCIVGHVLRDFGAPADLIRLRGNSIGVYSLAARLEMASDEFQISKAAVKVLVAAQEVQDEGLPWGDALARAVLAFLDLPTPESMGS